MTKFKLDMDPDPEVTLIGISSHVNDYRLCWALNRALGINLTRRKSDITDPGPEQLATAAVDQFIEVVRFLATPGGDDRRVRIDRRKCLHEVRFP